MIYLQISAGHGPAECRLGMRRLVKRMAVPDIHFQIVRQHDQSIVVSFDFPDERIYADSWIGTILWVCKDPIVKNRRRKNWYVGIREIEWPSEKTIIIKDDDLIWETMKSSGKGGQHANKNDTAVRLRHRPTGVSVISEDERSQKRNKSIALERLRAVLTRKQQDDIATLENVNWTQHNQIERGNPVRTFRGPDFEE